MTSFTDCKRTNCKCTRLFDCCAECLFCTNYFFSEMEFLNKERDIALIFLDLAQKQNLELELTFVVIPKKV